MPTISGFTLLLCQPQDSPTRALLKHDDGTTFADGGRHFHFGAELGQAMNTETSSLLIVDDEETNREGLARRLQRHGYSVTAVGSGWEAIELLGRRRFDMVL